MYMEAYQRWMQAKLEDPALTRELKSIEGQEEEIKDRFDRLLAQVQCDSKKALEKRLGTVQSVLVESPNDHDPSMVTGRLESNAIVHFPGSADLIGRIVQVKMTENRSFYYIGERVSV